MPIVYVHGVANRLDSEGELPGWDELLEYLRHYIAPTISSRPDQVPIKLAYWGDFGADFRWGGISRPRTRLRGQGPQAATIDDQLAELSKLDDLPRVSETSVSSGRLTSGQNRGAVSNSGLRLKDLNSVQLSDLLCSVLEKTEGVSNPGRTRVLVDDLANDREFRERLESTRTSEEEIELLEAELTLRARGTTDLVTQGSNRVWQSVVDRANEVVTRLNSAPAYALSRLAVEARGPLNDAVTTFFGDVFVYMNQKAENPGTIRGAVLAVFEAAKKEAKDPLEPFIVVSHSMGGQIVFDLATNFIGDQGLRIDFWVAAASQVGLFEELKLLIKSNPSIRGPLGRATFPANVGYWWNVWDANDILSYTTYDIFDLQVDNQQWNSGASVASAHGAYLRRPSFFRELARKISAAKEQNFNRP